MYQSINVYDFRDAFSRMGRQDQFSYKALGWLFDHMEEYEDQTGEKVELDVIALCCDYNEDKWLDVARNYGIDISDCADDEEIRDRILDHLNDETLVVNYDDDVVLFACF